MTIVLATGEERTELVELERVPFSAYGKIRFQVQNALAATAAAWAAGLNPAMIVRALTTFSCDTRMTPGRFNVTEQHGVEVIVDYGHNPAAMAALGDAVRALGQRRTVLLLTLPGDRRDEDLIATVDATLSFVDEYVLYDSSDLRGREPKEVPEILQRRIPKDIRCTIAAHEVDGLHQAWTRVHPGDRLIVIADQVDETLHELERVTQALPADIACNAPISALAAGR
jgi:cyanophycin synthetase